MKNDKNLQFITKSIEDAGQVMIYRNFTSGRKQAIGLKTAFSIDENGLLSFPLNTQYEENISTNNFNVELFFYKKGKPFYITANGMAKKDEAKQLSVQMDTVEFVETSAENNKSYFTNILSKGSKLMNLFM